MKELSSLSAITKTILPPASAIPSSSQSAIVPHAAHSTTTPTITTCSNTDSNDVTSASTISPSTETTPPPFSKSPAPMSMSFMNVPLSVPLNLPFLNMPLTMPPPMSLNMPISSDMLAPSESELGSGFHPQEEFNSTGREESKGKEKERVIGAQLISEFIDPSIHRLTAGPFIWLRLPCRQKSKYCEKKC